MISLVDAFEESIFNISKNSEEYKGMGTTIVVLLIIKNKVIIMNVGDSCAFLFVKENKILKLLSQDHSYISVSKVLKNKNNTINSENYQNIILNSIGTYSYIEPYCKVINTKNFNDFSLLLCSDGLTKNVKNEEIIDILNNNYGDSASEIVNKLIKRANENGGTDNISVAYFIKNKYGND